MTRQNPCPPRVFRHAGSRKEATLPLTVRAGEPDGPFPNRTPVIVLPFLTGGAALVASVVLRSLWLGALPRTVCPSCREATSSVRFGPRGLDRWLRRRWCAACGWSGWGRNGPVHDRTRPRAHDSGFHWGADRMEPDLGFRWGGTTTTSSAADHPSGFRFRSDDEQAPPGPPEPPGFRWGTNPVDPINDFRWKS